MTDDNFIAFVILTSRIRACVIISRRWWFFRDDILEPLLRNIYGPKTVLSWCTKGNQLYGQPMKTLKGLAFQGQHASRIGIISVLHLQQALGTLLLTLQEQSCQEGYPNCSGCVWYVEQNTGPEWSCGCVLPHDLQKIVCVRYWSEAVQRKVSYPSLSHDGVFGPGLGQTLKVCKEQMAQTERLDAWNAASETKQFGPKAPIYLQRRQIFQASQAR